MPPEWSNLVLSSNIPNCELDVFVLDGLDVEAWRRKGQLDRSRTELVDIEASLTDCRDGGNDFAEFQLVQDSSFSGSVETDHQDSHLSLSPELIEQLRKGETHIGERGMDVQIADGALGREGVDSTQGNLQGGLLAGKG